MILPFTTTEMRLKINDAASWPWKAVITAKTAMLEVFMNNKELHTAIYSWTTEGLGVTKITVEFSDGKTVTVERNLNGLA